MSFSFFFTASQKSKVKLKTKTGEVIVESNKRCVSYLSYNNLTGVLNLYAMPTYANCGSFIFTVEI